MEYKACGYANFEFVDRSLIAYCKAFVAYKCAEVLCFSINLHFANDKFANLQRLFLVI